MEKYKQAYRKNIVRPSWDEYYMAMAFLAAERSHDAETHHGCVITTKDHRVLSIGYNGFPRGMDDSSLPNLRPAKYPWMAHSERNALANIECRPVGGIAYVTGKCCFQCLYALYQHGIKEVVMYDGYGSHVSDEAEEHLRQTLIDGTDLTVRYIKPEFSFINNIKAFPLLDE